jgi:hypothetical protein
VSPFLILLIGVVYLYVAVENAYRGQWATAVTFGAYGVSNFGLMFLAGKA